MSLSVAKRLCLAALPFRVRRLLEEILEEGAGDAAGLRLTAWAGCPAEGSPSGGPESEYEDVFPRFVRRLETLVRQLDSERQQAVRLDEVLAHDPAFWRRHAGRSPELRSFPAFDSLLERADAALASDAGRAEELARFALDILQAMDSPEPAERLLLGYQCRAWALIGQAAALRQDWPAMQSAFDRAGRLVSRELLGSAEEAELLERHARALLRQGHESQALALLARAGEIAGELGETDREREALLRASIVRFATGDLARAAGDLAWALRLADQSGSLAEWLALRDQFAWVLLADDRVEEARELIREWADSSDPRHLVLVQFLADPTAQPSGAAALAVEVVEALRRGAAFEAAVAALLLARQGVRDRRLDDLQSLASTVAAVAASRQLSPASRALLGRFCRILLTPERVTLASIVEVAQWLGPAADDDDGEEPGDPREDPASRPS